MDCITFLEEARQALLINLPTEVAYLAAWVAVTVMIIRWDAKGKAAFDGMYLGPALKWCGIIICGLVATCQADYTAENVVKSINPILTPDAKYYCAENPPTVLKGVE